MMRNLLTLLPSGKLWLGDPRVGIPAEDIPEGSILETAASENPGTLLRAYVPGNLDGVSLEEDGTINSGSGFFWNLYIDGVLQKSYAYGDVVFKAGSGFIMGMGMMR